jgi:MoaA/NifB/PqqE/SkfB family radical SAM enzyme
MRYHANFYINRLVKEWIKNEKLIIACDIDDTILPFNEEIKNNCDKMVELILECQKEGIIFLINTARSKKQLENIVDRVESLGIKVDGVNQMHKEWNKDYGINGKLYANIFLDDRSGFMESYWTLFESLSIVKQERKKI